MGDKLKRDLIKTRDASQNELNNNMSGQKKQKFEKNAVELQLQVPKR